MFRFYINSLKINFILTRKIFLICLLFFGLSFFIQIYFDNDTSIASFTKGLVLSGLILNISLLIFGFKKEEEGQFSYLSNNFDLKLKHRIITKYLFLLLLNCFLIISYFIFKYDILLLGFIINITLTSILLFVYFNFGVKFLGITTLIISALTILYLQNPIFIYFNFTISLGMLSIYSVSLYILSLLVTLLLTHKKSYLYD